MYAIRSYYATRVSDNNLENNLQGQLEMDMIKSELGYDKIYMSLSMDNDVKAKQQTLLKSKDALLNMANQTDTSVSYMIAELLEKASVPREYIALTCGNIIWPNLP